MPNFIVRVEESILKRFEVEAATLEEARDAAESEKPSATLLSSSSESEAYQVDTPEGKCLWCNDGGEDATPEEDICDECGATYPENAESHVGPFHKESCSLYEKT